MHVLDGFLATVKVSVRHHSCKEQYSNTVTDHGLVVVKSNVLYTGPTALRLVCKYTVSATILSM